MKFTSKRLVSILLVLAFALAMLPMAVFATTPETLYLVPNSNWLIDSARFAAVLATDGWSAQVWVDAVDSDGDGVYEVAVPDDGNAYSIVIFCRMNPNATENSWDNKWNQTSDLTIPTDGTNCYTVEGGSWDAGNGTWSTFTPGDEVTPEETPALEITSITAVGTGSGNFLYGVEWDPTSGLNGASETEEGSGIYTVTYMGVAAGTYEFKFAANGEWTYNWGTGCTMESGVTYDATQNGSNSILVVGTDNSTVTLNIDLSAIDGNGDGATMSVEIEEPEVSSAPETMVLGENEFVIANGDSAAVTSSYTVEEAGYLVINATAMNTYDAYSDTWSAVPEAYIPMQFGRSYAVLVNGAQVWLPAEVEVAVGDVVEIGVQSYMGNAAEITLDLSIREPGINDVKWQLNADASADAESVDLRLISWVDSLDYSKVTFNVSIDGETSALDCTTVYTAINADGATISDPTIFDDYATYFVTYTIEDLPAAYYNSEIEVTMSWTDLDGNVTTSETRTIVVADDWA